MASDKKRDCIIIVVSIVILLSIFAVNFYFSYQEKPSPETGCIGNPTNKTVILIDHSESVPDQTKIAVIARVKKFIDSNVQTNELVSIYLISSDAVQHLIPAFSYCKPAKGNRLIQNVTKINENNFNSFQKPIDDALQKNIGGSNYTPLAQAIIDISLSEEFRLPDSSVFPKLVIFSDLMENTKYFDLYRSHPSTQSAIKSFIDARGGAKVRPQFMNAQIFLHVIPRQNLPPNVIKIRDGFWNWFFGDNQGDGAALFVDHLPGN